jgi:hypothetical protein
MLRTAFDAMVADPEFRADAEKMKLLVTPMSGAVVARHVEELYATPAAVVAKAKTITGYVLQIQGYAAAVGSAALNERLSSERASNVTAFLGAARSHPPDEHARPGRYGH